MPTDATRRSRRALLASAAGGAAVLAAAQLAKPAAALADDAPVLLNVDNPSTAITSITQGTAETAALVATGNGAGTGVSGISSLGRGVEGSTASGAGVLGTASEKTFGGVIGLDGPTIDSYFKAVEDDPVANSLKTGVYGWANLSDNSSGVFGESGDGVGVLGLGQWGCIGAGWPGVLGYSKDGTGLHGHGRRRQRADPASQDGRTCVVVVGRRRARRPGQGEVQPEQPEQVLHEGALLFEGHPRRGHDLELRPRDAPDEPGGRLHPVGRVQGRVFHCLPQQGGLRYDVRRVFRHQLGG